MSFYRVALPSGVCARTANKFYCSIVLLGRATTVVVPRHLRICVHCGSGEVDSVLHFVLNCSAHDGPRMRPLKTLREKLSPGFLTQATRIHGSRYFCMESYAALVMPTQCRCGNSQHESGSRGTPDKRTLLYSQSRSI